MTNRDRAIELHDLALGVVQARGVWQDVVEGGPNVCIFDDDHLRIAYLEESPIPPLYSLNVWRHSIDGWTHKRKMTKVLNMVWNDSHLRVVTYKAGWLRWEQMLEQLAASLARR